jgi:DNA-binding HxlR family transcriptional regulator
MMKMANISDLGSIMIQLENLADDLDKAVRDDPELLIKVNAGALLDDSLNSNDLYALIGISLSADNISGVTYPVREDYLARSMRKLETRGYLQKVPSNASGVKYALCGPKKCLKLTHTANLAWEDSRLSFYDRLVYIVLCCFSNTFDNTSTLSAGKIADATKFCEGWVRESLRDLEKYGLITKERRPGKSNTYRINEQAYESQEQEGRDTGEDEANG